MTIKFTEIIELRPYGLCLGRSNTKIPFIMLDAYEKGFVDMGVAYYCNQHGERI